MQLLARVVAISALSLIAGCSTLSSLNPFGKKTEPRNLPAPLVEFQPAMQVRTAWSVPIGASKGFSFTPAYVSGHLFAASADGSLVKLNADSGAIVWRISAGTALTAGVGSDGSTVAVGAEKGVLLAFDAQGKLRWKAQTSSEILSAPAVGQGLVIVRSIDNRIAAYDVETGTRRWITQRTAPPLSLRSAPGIVIDGATAFVGMPGGRLLALVMSNGAPRWEAPVGDPRGTTELERVADISGFPVVTNGNVCAVAFQGRVACLDAASGNPRWAKEISSDVGVGVDERFVFVSDERGAVNAFSREGGASFWRNPRLANRRLTTPVSLGRAVAVGDGQGYIHYLSREDGSFLARVPTDGSAILPLSPIVAGNLVMFQTQAGTLVALANQ